MSALVAPAAEIYEIPQPQLNEARVAGTNANYDTPIPGHSLVYYAAQDDGLAREIVAIQGAVQKILIDYGLQDHVKFYDIKQAHFSVIHLYDEPNQPQGLRQLAQVINNLQPLQLIFGPNAKLSEEGRDQTLRLTDSGQGVMKGVAIDKNHMSPNQKYMLKIREEIEGKTGIAHRYANDDQVYAVLFYFLNTKVNEQPKCLREINNTLKEMGGNLYLEAKVNELAIASFQHRTLDPKSTKRINFTLGEENGHIKDLPEVLKEQRD